MLRLIEDRSRQQMRDALPCARVCLKGLVSSDNTEALNLFEREGYTLVREFWRVTVETDEALEQSHPAGKLKLDVHIESRQLVGAAPLYDREGVYSIRRYCEYEKELRPIRELEPCEGAYLSATC